MNENYMFSLMAVILLFLLAVLGVDGFGLYSFFGIFVPYLSFAVFVGFFLYRVIGWARSPVPFRIPTTCGQGKSLPWIKHAPIDNPSTTGGVVVRMLLEIVLFRSLFRNVKLQFRERGAKIFYDWELWLWIAALAFHWAFFAVVVRHLRFFTEPTPGFVKFFEYMDSFFRVEILTDVVQIGLPAMFISGFVLLVAVVYLLLRRMFIPKVKYISLSSDYFPLFLIIAIAVSGILMRYVSKVDIVSVKAFTLSLVKLSPALPEGVGTIFYVHLFLVCVLLVYFPFSKLMHMGGVFMSPTRNLANNTRMKRHVNPWNYPVDVHTYEEYEEEFRDKMIEAGLPVEKGE